MFRLFTSQINRIGMKKKSLFIMVTFHLRYAYYICKNDVNDFFQDKEDATLNKIAKSDFNSFFSESNS